VTVSFWTVERCTFINNFRDFEQWSWNVQPFWGNKFINNNSINCRETAIIPFTGAGDWTVIKDLQIRGNTIMYNPAMQDTSYGNHKAISMALGQDILIADNFIQDAEEGIFLQNGTANGTLKNVTIRNNHIRGCAHGVDMRPIAATSTNLNITLEGNTFEYGLFQAVIFGGLQCRLVNNIFNGNVTFGGSPTVSVSSGGVPGPQGSNIISGNLFIDEGAGVGSPTYAIQVASGLNNNIISGNQINKFVTAPYTDAGANNTWFGNVVGTNLLQVAPLSSINAVATAANTTETDLMAYSIPANALILTNNSIELLAWGNFGATANNKDVRVKFGGAAASNVLLDTLLRNNNAQEWILSGTIQYVNATTMKTAFRFEVTGFVTNDIATFTIGATTNIILRVTGSNTVAAASDIGLEGWKVAWKP
jgi:hypothetical protein